MAIKTTCMHLCGKQCEHAEDMWTGS